MSTTARTTSLRVTCLGSGSSGNALLIQSPVATVLLDAGLPIRTLTLGLAALGVASGCLDAVLISHEHSDHVRALPQVARASSAPLFATAGTIRCLSGGVHAEWCPVRPGARFQIGDLHLTPVGVSHDASEPVGFVVEHEETRVAIFTDLGEVNQDVADGIRGASLVIFESNYDEEMLRRGSYPALLKRRIRGPKGHLSNDDCAQFLARCLDGAITEVWLAHLSENNNRPALARAATLARLDGGPYAPAVTPLARRGRTQTWDAAEVRLRPRQLGLF